MLKPYCIQKNKNKAHTNQVSQMLNRLKKCCKRKMKTIQQSCYTIEEGEEISQVVWIRTRMLL